MTLNDSQRDSIVKEALSWIGTPWHHEARVKGRDGGVDCVMLLCEVYERVGVLPHVIPVHYAMDIMLHRGNEVVLGYLEQYGVEVEAPSIGGVVVYRFARSFSHAGIYVGDGQIVHAVRAARMVMTQGIDEGALEGKPRKFFDMRGIE